MTRRLFILVVPMVLFIAACGEDDGGENGSEPSASATAGSSQEVNDADVQFAQSMIPHHRQAVEMADIALEPSSEASREVTRLAKAIKSAQGPEIKTMSTWLDSWGKPLDDGGMDTSSDTRMGDDMSEMSDDGMMSAEEMSELEGLTGVELDRRWLEMMIEHHEGAVEMAELERSDGASPDALELAADIIATQEAEIAEMRELLGS